MTVKNIGSNKTEVERNGSTFLVSYAEVVAALVPGRGWLYTSKKWSATTSKHITKWLGVPRDRATAIDQSELETLFNGG